MSLKDFDAMTAACIAAADHVNRCGSPQLKTAMRVLLLVLGREVADRSEPPPSDPPRRRNGNGQT